MPDTDILKAKTFSNGQVIAVTKILERLDRHEVRIEYVNKRIDKKFKQAIE